MDIKTIDGKAPGASEDTAFTIGFKMPVRPIDANALYEEAIDKLGDGEVLYRFSPNDIDNAPTLSLNTLRDEIYQDAVAHGLWDWAESYRHMPDLRDSSVDLIRGEVCELEIECGSEERYAEELADVIIMSMSVAGKLGIDIDAAIRRKMEINKGRPWKHGKSNE